MYFFFFKKPATAKVYWLIALLIYGNSLFAQTMYELNKDWKCQKASYIPNGIGGNEISNIAYNTTNWLPAVVPGTVLTSLLENKLIPDPFYGMNNKLIPDIYRTGTDYYTYWFVTDFTDSLSKKGGRIWLNFRGVNYGFRVFINGKEVTEHTEKGMFLRHSFNITSFLNTNGNNRLAIIVYPPEPVGEPNGGQGGDGTIARSVTNQFVAGWDWIQPIADRNTGIWDKVTIEHTGTLKLKNPHIVTIVKGIRQPEQQAQPPATIKLTAEVENTSSQQTQAILQYSIEGKTINKNIILNPNSTTLISMPNFEIKNPRLWWPNGYGQHPLYSTTIKVLLKGGSISDSLCQTFGIRDIKGVWNTHTLSREVQVNGQKIFIKGGNWIASDAMMRFSADRYDAEIRMQHDMNLNLIRVWGGSLTERPEFYNACDKYGMLVMQDFWVSGDCNGRWSDSLKKDDTLIRRNYPDDHKLFNSSLKDQILMLRNHTSLAIWCGGNEIKPPMDILKFLKDTLLPKLDGTRIFFAYSNDDSMSLNSHDGPYTVQTEKTFFEKRSYAFNSEIGSVGIGDYESIEKFIPKQNLIMPKYNSITNKWDIDSVWQYHKYVGYDSTINKYGQPTDIQDFCKKAQLVNYNQYRALFEGFTAHEWDWYTGVIEWKTQNPWTAMVGQMYDCYLDPNACLYGANEGAKQEHVFYNPVQKSVMGTNNNINKVHAEKLNIKIIDNIGSVLFNYDKIIHPETNIANTYFNLGNTLDSLSKKYGSFLYLSISDSTFGYSIDENFYWIPNISGNYSGLEKIKKAKIKTLQHFLEKGIIEIYLENPISNPVAFFIRLAVVDPKTKKRILPTFYSNNYISILPGRNKTILIEFKPQPGIKPMISVEGWNVEKQYFTP